MLNKLPLGTWPAKRATAVVPDRRFVAELTGTLEAELDVPEFDALELDAPELEAVDVLELLACAEAIWAFTRLSACWLAMPARPVV